MEHKHRHLLTIARALRFQAHLPLRFQPHTTVYLINRTPNLLLRQRTPYELLYKRPPIYHHLRVFGCLCYATHIQTIHKFDQHAKKCLFLRYPSGQKAYKVWDLDAKKMISRKDKFFYEFIFPYSTITHDMNPCTLVLPLTNSRRRHSPNKPTHCYSRS